MIIKQDKLYKNILMEIYNSGIDLKYNGFKLNTLKTKNGGIENKIKVKNVVVEVENSDWENLPF